MNRHTPVEVKTSRGFNMWQDLRNHLVAGKKVSRTIEKNIKEKQDLLKNLRQAKRDLEIASANFEFVADKDLVDYYIYQMKAAETKYQYLIRKAKEKNIRMDECENIHIWNRNTKVEMNG
ncbi:MAG: YaaL family protein [Clostridiaceae bacterium]|nr:YaaL family protein [Clostridiaceae bacterium]